MREFPNRGVATAMLGSPICSSVEGAGALTSPLLLNAIGAPMVVGRSDPWCRRRSRWVFMVSS